MEFDVRVSVHQSKILTEKPNNMQQCIKIFIIPHFIWSSTRFGRHTAHYQVVGRAVVGRFQVAYATWQRQTTARPTTFHSIMQNQRLLVQF